MRSKPILASFIPILLLLISCVANACETSCDLMALESGCHHASSAAVAISMAGMHSCGINLSKRSAQIHTNDQCEHAVCEQQPQIVTGDQRVLHSRLLSAHQALTTVLLLPVNTLNARIEPANTAPPRPPLLMALQTTLRV
jgi:hypothetical protein